MNKKELLKLTKQCLKKSFKEQNQITICANSDNLNEYFLFEGKLKIDLLPVVTFPAWDVPNTIEAKDYNWYKKDYKEKELEKIENWLDRIEQILLDEKKWKLNFKINKNQPLY